jgi:hypothetical protein
MTADDNYTTMRPAALLAALGDDARLWARAFCQHARTDGYDDLDEDWVCAWFANAIEHSHNVRAARSPGSPKDGGVVGGMIRDHAGTAAPGWAVGVNCAGRRVVWPLNDLRDHEIDGDCWCNPFADDGVVVHNSMDRRELLERHGRVQ